MQPDHAGRYLLTVASLPLAGLDVGVGPSVRWQEDPITALWDAIPERDGDNGLWRTQVERLLRALDREGPHIVRAQAMLRLVVLYRTGALLPNERASLTELVRSQVAPLVSSNPGPDVMVADGATPIATIAFPLPVRFLLELPEQHPGDAAAAVRGAILGRPLPHFARARSDGRPATWTFGGSQGADPLFDVLVATRKPWRTNDESRTIDWTPADATALLNSIEAWWDVEGPALWREIQEDHGPFNSAMPHWRFSSIAEIVALAILPARGHDRTHLARASALIRRMRAEEIPIDLALPVLAADDTGSRIEVARALRLSLASTDLNKATAALLAVFAWLNASDRSVLEHPPRDLLQEVSSMVRSRRGPALATALQLATVVLYREISDIFLEDVSIGLQHLAEETRYDRADDRNAGKSEDSVLLRLHAVRLLAAYAPHVPAEDETVRLWITQVDYEPIRSVRRVLANLRDEVAGRAAGSEPREDATQSEDDSATLVEDETPRQDAQLDNIPPV